MADLTRDDILKLARLARLDLTEAEIEEYRSDLTDILQYVEQLQSVDVEGLVPTNQVTGLVNVTREDTLHDYGYDVNDLRKNLPSQDSDHIKVQRMIG